ncbi:interferon-induced very large GTPase 1-like [Pelobates fuscus]|uniref:interferon-induced very large GTPase 1-like n=1 Tax=Pelobates fuscus TaxID=191477 RepID=UPI002FE4D5DA
MMDPAMAAAWTVNRLKWKLIEVFEEGTNDLLDELSSLHAITIDEYIRICTFENPVERTEEVLNLILEKGEPVCNEFLNHLENIIPRFPKLPSLSRFFPETKKKVFDELLMQLSMEGMEWNQHIKFPLKNILEIAKNNLMSIDIEKIQDIPWHFLRKLMALNRTARNTYWKKTTLNQGSSEDEDINEIYGIEIKNDTLYFLHPMDVLCVLLHCSDIFLQQEIVSKMAMCQFAVPLLLPADDGSNCTFMLWAMRNIVKRWRPHSSVDSKGFMEENVVSEAMPILSFVKIGKTKLSKSKILNQVLSPPQQYHDFFIHNNMEGGNNTRKISDGLVEMSWYFPSGSERSDIFPEPIAVTNLRGDMESNWTQFSFLTRVSSAVFIFTNTICEREIRLLSKCIKPELKYYLIITLSSEKDVNDEIIQNLQKCKSLLKFGKNNIILKKIKENDAILVKKIQNAIRSFIKDSPRMVIQNMTKCTNNFGICIDEGYREWYIQKNLSTDITQEIKDVVQYKKETMSLQGDLWKQISKIEKELCRMKNQEGKDAEQYQCDLKNQLTSLHKRQYEKHLPSGIQLFIDGITDLTQAEKHHFLKLLEFDLDKIARINLSTLQAEYMNKCKDPLKNLEELKEIDKKISDSSLRIEHFLREMGQFYEAECSMYRRKQIQKDQRKYTRLPGIAADLLLDGLPLELIDGDASNIPLQWITDVLTELDTKTGGQCRMRVITVLGIQSTGKSTLLNTMFGLQFPVASGRCTRGAFMTFIKVENDFQVELGCEFILVIDTEGLKAPELAFLEDSYEHDNELATLVVGLSDITIINMSMENTAEIKDILQIVVHAILRLKHIGKKPNCQFVHQNVSDVSTHEKNMRARKKLLDQLDEITNIAAKIEKKYEITRFNDVIEYNIEKDNWYIPGLWLGIPPMAPVNSGYSEKISELKQYLLDLVKMFKSVNTPLQIREFIIWIKSLWNAVKHEKFLFSFRNSLVTEAYYKLCVQFSEWEWNFTKYVHSWVITKETLIMNQPADKSQTETCVDYRKELEEILCENENKMLVSLKKYFEDKSENVNLIEKYFHDFTRSIESLKKELELNAIKKCNEAFNIQEVKFKIQCLQENSMKMIESNVINLLEDCRKANSPLNKTQLEEKFNSMWERIISDLQFEALKSHNISQSIVEQLHKSMRHKETNAQKLLILNNLDEYGHNTFEMDKKYLDLCELSSLECNMSYIHQDCFDKTAQLANFLIDTCDKYVEEKISMRSGYYDIYCQELLRLIDDKLENKDVKKYCFNSLFEVDIKLFILGRAARAFQEMHETFLLENDPKICLENLKPKYFSTFVSIYEEKDQSHHMAKKLCELCLKPALTQYIYKHLGKEIVDDCINSLDSIIFKNRPLFHVTVLENLLEKEIFEEYVNYINSYESFLKNWVLKYISDKYRKSPGLQMLQSNLLSSVVERIKDVLKKEKCTDSPKMSNILENICEELKSELVIPQNQMHMIGFGDNTNIERFSADIETFLSETENQIQVEMSSLSVEFIIAKVTLNPVDELLKKVIGCGKQCPFCKAPCEAGGVGHTEHFASIHRPKSLGGYKKTWEEDCSLVTEMCSMSGRTFRNQDTDWKDHSYKEYRTIYPDWSIQPDPSIESTDYWKYIFAKFNEQFAEEYKAKPAELSEQWKQIDKEQALRSLKEAFNIKQ